MKYATPGSNTARVNSINRINQNYLDMVIRGETIAKLAGLG